MEPLVSVWMITYNHEKYIAQALDSVLMQKTSCCYEIVIGEDCSTDDTRAILKTYESNYPHIIKPVYYKENVGAFRNAYEFTLPLCKGKYIACLEGDDYWIDPYKLQKQVDFLEANSDYGMVHTGVNVVDNENQLILISNSPKPSGEVFYDLILKSAFIVTCSVCVRRDIVYEAVNHAMKNNLKCIFDYWLWLNVAMRSKIHYNPDITSAYRSHSFGVTQSVKGLFNEIIPLAVLDTISYKLITFPEKEFNKKWKLYVNYCRALTASRLKWKDRGRYFNFLLQQPIFLFAFLPAIWCKVKLRLSV
jgi:glycosyltransferase involved in cell wall biosynthesis